MNFEQMVMRRVFKQKGLVDVQGLVHILVHFENTPSDHWFIVCHGGSDVARYLNEDDEWTPTCVYCVAKR